MKSALIIVDMQRAYFNNETLERVRDRLVSSCNQLVDVAGQKKMPVIMLRTVHDKSGKSWTLNMLDDGHGYLFEGEEDSQYIEGLKTEGSIEIIKTRDSGFWDTELLSILRQKSIDSVLIAGVSTHSCIMATAMDSYNANLRVTLVTDAIATHDPKRHESTLDMLQQEYRVKIISSSDVECIE